ncbi:MAG: hypothetical protein ACE5ID_04530, partial [Acidobacteriota bacterium]
MTVTRTGHRAAWGAVVLLLVTLGGDRTPAESRSAPPVAGGQDPRPTAFRGDAQSAAVCGTLPGLRSRLLERHLRRMGSERAAEEQAGPARAAGGLQQLLGTSVNLEDGSVVERDGVIILVDDGTAVTGSFQAGFKLDTLRLAQEYYAVFPDDVDVLTFLPDFDHQEGTFQLSVRNSIQGINRPNFDDTAIFGSTGRLQSVQMFADFTRRPQDPTVRPPGDHDSTLSLLAHEFAHQFGAFVRVDADQRPGVVDPQGILLGRKGSHWCFFLDTRSAFGFPDGTSTGMSSLEGNLWRQDTDG